MIFSEFLAEVGVHVTAHVIAKVGEAISDLFRTNSNPSKEELQQTISSVLNIEDAEIYAEKLIDILAENGKITINDSKIHSNTAVSFFSNETGSVELTNTVSSTPNTRISVQGTGASIKLSGNAHITQSEGGTIKISTK